MQKINVLGFLALIYLILELCFELQLNLALLGKVLMRPLD